MSFNVLAWSSRLVCMDWSIFDIGSLEEKAEEKAEETWTCVSIEDSGEEVEWELLSSEIFI
jgi:hypothetical protein